MISVHVVVILLFGNLLQFAARGWISRTLERTIYSVRHTAIRMRIILSQGKVNIFNLAKNAGTSVNQIERFYARNLPLSPELPKNLQSFGE